VCFCEAARHGRTDRQRDSDSGGKFVKGIGHCGIASVWPPCGRTLTLVLAAGGLGAGVATTFRTAQCTRGLAGLALNTLPQQGHSCTARLIPVLLQFLLVQLGLLLRWQLAEIALGLGAATATAYP